MQRLAENLKRFDIGKQEGKIIVFFGMALLIYLLFILYADVKKITSLVFQFRWNILPLLLLLTLLNYLLRAIRFHLYLKELSIKVTFLRSILIFFSGLSMTVTPGKTGEIIKAYLVNKTTQNKLSELIPLLIVERLTDGIAMIIMAVGGIFILKSSGLFFFLAAVFVLCFIAVVKAQNYVISLILLLEKRFPRLKMLDFFLIFFKNSQKLLTLKSLSLGIGIGILAWSLEGISLFILVREFTQLDLFNGISISFFIFSFSSIAGFFAFIPGGIGVAEGSITYFLGQFFSLPVSQAIFITILFRFITLWLGVSIGLICLMVYLRKYLKRQDYFL